MRERLFRERIFFLCHNLCPGRNCHFPDLAFYQPNPICPGDGDNPEAALQPSINFSMDQGQRKKGCRDHVGDFSSLDRHTHFSGR
jgi:hypothetical protein